MKGTAWIAGIVLFGFSAAAICAHEPDQRTGRQLFERYCAACHGPAGEGDGPVSPLFKVPPPSLTRLQMSNQGIFPRERVRNVIVGAENMAPHGERRMPVWGTELPANSVAMSRLLDYLASIQRK